MLFGAHSIFLLAALVGSAPLAVIYAFFTDATSELSTTIELVATVLDHHAKRSATASLISHKRA